MDLPGGRRIAARGPRAAEVEVVRVVGPRRAGSVQSGCVRSFERGLLRELMR